MGGTPKAAAIYSRISKDTEGTGLGVQRQEALCRKLADEKGWQVAKVYTDNDLSAFRGEGRPGYEHLLADLEAGSIDAVLVVDQDRLTRHPMELESFITIADRLGVHLANVSGDIDLSTSDGRFRARILGAVARQESEKKSERIRRQKDQAASKGWAQGGRRRYGYRHARTADGRATLDLVPSEAEIIREAAFRFLNGETLRKIALDFNARGIPTATGGEAKWRVTTLRTMLGGPHITALRVHRGEIVGDGNWEPILDRATWERIRTILGDPRRRRGGRPAIHLLTGLLKCSRCGGTLTHSSRPAPSGRYSCDPPPNGCARIAISAARVEERPIPAWRSRRHLAMTEREASWCTGLPLGMDSTAMLPPLRFEGAELEAGGWEVPVDEEAGAGFGLAECRRRCQGSMSGSFGDRPDGSVDVVGFCDFADGFFADEPAHVVQGGGVGDSGEDDLGSVVVDHGLGEGGVHALELGEVLPDGYQLDADTTSRGRQLGEVGERSDVGGLVNDEEEGFSEAGVRMVGPLVDGVDYLFDERGEQGSEAFLFVYGGADIQRVVSPVQQPVGGDGRLGSGCG